MATAHHTPQHSNGKSKAPWGTVLGIVSLFLSLPFSLAAIAEFASYTPYGDPGAGGTAFVLALLAGLLFAIPVLVFFCKIFIRYSDWKKTLTPAERLAVSAAELAAMTVASVKWHEHNKEVSARLTDSAMGRDRSGEA